MHTLDMPMQIRPAQTSSITTGIRTIIAKQKHRILVNLEVLIMNAQIAVGLRKVSRGKVLVSLVGVVGIDDSLSFSLRNEELAFCIAVQGG